ncbi:D-arabinono-1,4-lactone oxidase, putative [Coccidioides posadasii C735 delta SOWgp]|uniref:D-arabinono-1,4-lactone oxidase n=1 Tax=Coccidioides posadasii (strain C735) TaxID=222929 RepID=C5PAG4_COCP7|nr:D-arabinono-1,4-lactone oxidase, putative [Coccidioides posadasii C735 delta SOWgp]EER26726.1 D-arabinono-1,4-lactone oxidase, putative [Coccidioides posadasii C735 delta SOWgp]|eukprot:XP_003068871.1 D-arabinono-1,4-lactone oxidase, putative [Coccidioides posadasii C735 delta SOWgp]
MDSLDPQVSYELSKLDPDVPFRATKAHLHHTWAKTFYSQPELYIQPESVAEIQKVVNLARKCRRRLVTVGSGHSPSDLTCTSSWIVNLDNFRRILSFSRETGVVTVESGIRLWQLGDELEKCGLMLPNLGSIDSQSIAGVISTGTHGSSLRFGLLSDSVQALSIALANGQVVRCSKTNNPSLFRAALLSLGALGIITEITIQAVPTFNIAWKQTLKSLPQVLEEWDSGLWTSSEYVRVWWLPYLKRAVVWRADKTDLPLRKPRSTFYGGRLGNAIYHNLLYLSNYFPRILPWIEWFIFGMQYGFKPGKYVAEAVEPGRTGLLMNCLYSQFVNEWAIPLEKGPQAISRLSAWLNGDAKAANIPFSPKGLWVHCPIEVRVSDTSKSETPRPYLEQTNKTGPTLYLNATLYRPHLRDPPCTARYYEAFEWLMRDLGGRPHWAKNFGENLGPADFQEMYGADLNEWLRVRNEADPHGMFLGEWHRRTLLPAQHAVSNSSEFPLAEREKSRRKFGKWGSGDGVEWVGDKSWSHPNAQLDKPGESEKFEAASPSPPATATSEESFDYLAHGEASIMGSSNPNGQDSSNF